MLDSVKLACILTSGTRRDTCAAQHRIYPPDDGHIRHVIAAGPEVDAVLELDEEAEPYEDPLFISEPEASLYGVSIAVAHGLLDGAIQSAATMLRPEIR